MDAVLGVWRDELDVEHPLLGTQPRHPYLLIELQTLDPSTLPYGSVLSMIAKFEQARSPEQSSGTGAGAEDLKRVGGTNDDVDRTGAAVG